MKNEERRMKNDCDTKLNEERKKGRTVQAVLFSLLTFLFSLVLGCDNSLTLKDNAALPTGQGSFSLTLSNAGRTILPNTPNLNDFAVYNLAFTPAGGGTAANVDRTNANLATAIPLAAGTYNLAVNAYKDSAKTQLMASGTLNAIVITAGQNTAAAVTLKALFSGGTGTFKWNVTFPTGVTTANMTIVPANAGGTAEQTVALTGNPATGDRTLNSGQYNLTFNLEKGDGKVVWKELLYVYQNLESVYTFTFTEAHFINPNYTVTFDSNGGSNVGQASVLHGNTVTKPANPTKDGYALDDWYADNDTFANAWDFATTVIEDITLYANWLAPTGITAVYNSTAAIFPSTPLDNLKAGLTVTANFSNSTNQTVTDYTLGGALNVGESTVTVTYGDDYTTTFTVTVLDDNMTVTNTAEWNNALNIIRTSGNNMVYSITVTGDVGVAGSTANTFGSVTGLSVTLKGNGKLYLNSQGRIITLAANQTLIIDSADLTLQGLKNGQNGATEDNDNSLVYINGNNAQLELKNGAISGNTNTGSGTSGSAYGGGVYINSGTFIMRGGTISGNTATGSNYVSGGGVFVSSSSSFIMYGGEIAGNTASSYYICGGGGVMNGGTFRIVNGTVYGSNEGALSNNVVRLFNSTGGSATGAALNNEGTAQRGTFSDETWSSKGTLSTNNSTIRVDNGELISIGAIAAPVWREDNAVSLAVPAVTGFTTTAQDWQISDNGTGGWTDFTPPATADISHNGKYLRYYATSDSSGQTYYSNVVVMVVNPAVVSIAATYEQGETMVYPSTPLNNLKTGLTVTADYRDNTTKTLAAAEYALSGTLTAGESIVTVTYEGKEATFTVTVTVPSLTGIRLTKQPDKIIYIIGEQFDDTGLQVTADYNDGSTVTVTAEDITGFESSTAGDITLTVTYNGKTATFTVTVVDADFVVTNTDKWNTALSHINGGGNDQSYTIYISGNVGVAGSAANSFGSVSGLSVTLRGSGRLSLNSNGNIVRIGTGQTLIIDSAALTLQGRSGNNTSAVYVDGSGAQLELQAGTISGNTNDVRSSSHFVTINSYGGGVYVTGGSFTMHDGTISGNTAYTSNSGDTCYSYSYGGGVYVTGNGSFTMHGGTISGNRATASGSSSYVFGGGVGVNNGTLTMHNGTVSGNTASISGSYSSQSANASGGGVYVGGTFTMHNGTVSGNTASVSGFSSYGYSYGGGMYVSVSGSSFTMYDGTVSGNTASATASGTATVSEVNGGGMYLGSGTIRIVTCTVYGNNETNTSLRNTVTGSTAFGAALSGTAQRGTFNGSTWNNAGSLTTTNNTIKVLNGVLQ